MPSNTFYEQNPKLVSNQTKALKEERDTQWKDKQSWKHIIPNECIHQVWL